MISRIPLRTSAWSSRRQCCRSSIHDRQHELFLAVRHVDTCAGRGRVLQHIGEGLLQNAVRRDVEPGREPLRRPFDTQSHIHTGHPRPLNQLLEQREPGERGLVLVRLPEHAQSR